MNTLKTIALLGIAHLLITACNGPSAAPSESNQQAEVLHISAQQFAHEKMQVSQIQNIAFETHINCNGSLQARPNGKALLNAPLPGIIQSISCQNGQTVKDGQTLFEVGGTPLIDLQKDFAEAAAEYGRLKSEFERAQTLFQEQVSAEKEYRATQSAYLVERAHYQGLKLKIETLGLSPQKIEAGEFYASYPVKSPIGGRVSGLQANIGTHTDGSTALATVIDAERMQLQLNVFPRDLAVLREGQSVRYRLAHSDSLYQARLQAIGSTLNQASRAVDCYATLSGPLPEGAIADQFISATIVTQSDSIQALPSEAILQTETGPVVLLLQKQDDEGYNFVATPIKTGRQYKSHTEILDGPARGQFLTAGLYNLVL